MFYKGMDISQHTMERLLQVGGGALVSPLLDRKSWSLRIHWHRWCDGGASCWGLWLCEEQGIQAEALKGFQGRHTFSFMFVLLMALYVSSTLEREGSGKLV